jgi:hypothetical protein
MMLGQRRNYPTCQRPVIKFLLQRCAVIGELIRGRGTEQLVDSSKSAVKIPFFMTIPESSQ